MNERAIDPSECWVRHIRRSRTGEARYTTVGRGRFTSEPLDGVNGRQGWQSAQITAALQADGDLAIRFPNAAGDDGVLHRRRFAIRRKDSAPYRTGEEWLELYREPHDLLAVATPYSAELNGSELTLKCWTVDTFLNRFRPNDIDLWDGAAPRDVWEHYTQAPVQIIADDFVGTGVLPSNVVNAAYVGANGRTYRIDTSTVTASSIDPRTTQPRLTCSAGQEVYLGIEVPAFTSDCWVTEATFEVGAGGTGPFVRLDVYDQTDALAYMVPLTLDDGKAPLLAIGSSGNGDTRRQGMTPEGLHSIRLAAFYDWVILTVDGEVLGSFRRAPTDRRTVGRVDVAVEGTRPVTFRGISVKALAPFALRGTDKGDLTVPGTPPAGGLRMRTYDASRVYTRTETDGSTVAVKEITRSEQLPYLYGRGDEPAFDGQIADLNARRYQDGLAAFQAAAAIFTGAIRFDNNLDWRLRVTGGPNVATIRNRARVRVYIAGKLYFDNWRDSAPAAYPVAGARLSTFLNSQAPGWYPIKVEVRSAGTSTDYGFVTLERATDNGAIGAYTVVPSTDLSPLGTYEGEHRAGDSHRAVLDELVETFGYQWRVDPRQLESGEFPGQIIPRARVGIDYALSLAVSDENATELVSTVDAADVADRLVADAAGIADPNGSGQLSAEVIDFNLASSQAFLQTNSESLANIGVLELLLTRLNTVHALHIAPNETVGARSRGQRDLSKPAGLVSVSALDKTRWRPGDGVRLEVQALDVIDRSPRQMTRVQMAVFPDGVNPPQVGFRDRPRDAQAYLRRMMRLILAPQRNYQGQLAYLTGASGGVGFATVDTYSRVALPADVGKIAGVWLVVKSIAQTVAPTIEINGVSTSVPVANPGWYDVKPYVARSAAGSPWAYARLTGGTFTSAGYDLVVLAKV